VVFTGIFGALVLIALIAGIAMVEASLAFGIAMLFAITMFYMAVPHSVKLFMTHKWVMHPLDLGFSALVPMIVGFTLTGVFGGVLLGIMLTLMMKFEHMRLRRLFSWQKKLYTKKRRRSC